MRHGNYSRNQDAANIQNTWKGQEPTMDRMLSIACESVMIRGMVYKVHRTQKD